MSRRRPVASRRPVLAATVTLAALLGVAPAVAPATATACTHVYARPGTVGAPALGRATLCLLNRERAARGLAPLREDRRLARAARGHAGDMVKRTYFDHDTLGGRSFVARIRRAGYVPRAGRWQVGENIAWGAGRRATPRAIVRAWMRSPAHKDNILWPRFRDVGLGIAVGDPLGDRGDAVTLTTDFGRLGG